jgi:putative ABC transport system permease protein
MIYNYLKIAYRNLLKYKFISFINLFGLTVGFTCCLVILMFIVNELSYDRYHTKADRIYRVTRAFNGNDGKKWLELGTVAPPFAPLLQNDFPDIQKITRLLRAGTLPFRYSDKVFNEDNVFFADEHFFSIFDVQVVKGDPSRALNDPYSVMVSEDVAKKYFGSADPLDKLLKQGQNNVKVTGVFKSFPQNAHLHPEIMLSFNTLKDTLIYGEENLRTNWGNNSFFTYLLLPENYPAKSIEAQFPAFIDKHMSAKGSSYKPSQGTSLALQKLSDIHLRSHLDYEAEENGDIKRVYIFSAIALFILLIACINYMNLSTARSALRAREIGVRKVVGAERKEIILQFLSESVLVTSIAMILSLVASFTLAPWISDVTGQHLKGVSILQARFILPLILLPFAVGILSGIYPALFMSSFKPVTVLKGLLKTNHSRFSFRHVLVVFQFAVSIVLIICTIVVFQQLSYMQNKALGYDRDHIVTLLYPGGLNSSYESFRNQVLQYPAIKNTARSSRIPTGRLLDAQNARMPVGDSTQPVNADIKYVVADYDFIPSYGIQMAAGRNFSKEYGTDTAGFIINETTVPLLGIASAAEAIGKPFIYSEIRGRIIGVVKDFHFESMHQKIAPMVLVMPSAERGSFYNYLTVKVAGNDIKGSLAALEKQWTKFLPETPFDYVFLDENFNRLYQAETRQGSMFTTFSLIAIFIACLGLFGLSAFTITQRLKEIGIRKVLGASTGSLVQLVSKDFMKLVIVSAVIAFPVAWFAMSEWLQDFAYRTNIKWWIFIAALALAALIALITISLQAIKAAISNPVKNLRTE